MWLPSLWLPPHEATVGGFVVFLSVLCGKVMCIGSNAFCGDQRPLSILCCPSCTTCQHFASAAVCNARTVCEGLIPHTADSCELVSRARSRYHIPHWSMERKGFDALLLSLNS